MVSAPGAKAKGWNLSTFPKQQQIEVGVAVGTCAASAAKLVDAPPSNFISIFFERLERPLLALELFVGFFQTDSCQRKISESNSHDTRTSGITYPLG